MLVTGHAGDVIGDMWYIVGGGNNTSGCTDTVALDLSPLADAEEADGEADEPLTWSTVSQAEARSAIASEGLIVEAAPFARCLLSFGGYNGKYQSALQVFKPGRSRHTLACATPLHLHAVIVNTCSCMHGQRLCSLYQVP